MVKNKRVSLRWEMNSILMQILQKNFFCINHQHGRLVTWLQTKNNHRARDDYNAEFLCSPLKIILKGDVYCMRGVYYNNNCYKVHVLQCSNQSNFSFNSMTSFIHFKLFNFNHKIAIRRALLDRRLTV